MIDVETIRAALVSGRYRITLHARRRMSERMISDSDIGHCALSARIKKQDDGKFKVSGENSDGDELTIICAWDGETIIITLF